MYKKYLNKSIIIFVTLMFVIGGINFIVDPGEIYLKKILADMQCAEFSKQLFASDYGIVQTGWNERLVKTTLAKEAGKFDCVILGSSHIMQVSGVRNTGKIKSQCKNILNLGVSGGSIEDISIFSYLILNNINLPKQIFIGIDPWTLKFGMDSRFGAYNDYYDKMNVMLKDKEAGKDVSYLGKLIKNLFNGEYFYYSVLSLINKTENKKMNDGLFNKNIIFPKDKFAYSTGYTEAVTLQDGSHVYDKNWILQQKSINPKIAIGGSEYKIYGEAYDEATIQYLKKIIDLYQNNNIKVNLVLTPYHPNVFKGGNTKLVIYITAIEKIIKKFSAENHIKLYGSYFPDKLGCTNEDFYDFMHATNNCLNKIDFSGEL